MISNSEWQYCFQQSYSRSQTELCDNSSVFNRRGGEGGGELIYALGKDTMMQKMRVIMK